MSSISIFTKIFGKFTNDKQAYSRLQLTSSSDSSYSTFTENMYESVVTRACIHAIATNAAKLKPVYVGGESKSSRALINILGTRPNPIMSAYDFYYKLITQLYNKNNAFALIERGVNGSTIGIYPINYSSVEALEYQNEIFLKFGLDNGKGLTVPYMDVLHLRRFFYNKELFGEDNQALYPTLQVIDTTNQGLEEGVKSSAVLRGILKFNSVIKASDMKAQRDTFINDYLDITNNGGVAATDSKFDYVPITQNAVLINSDQMKAIRDQVYLYFNVNEEFVTNQYEEEGWNAVYESLLEPLSIQMSQECTYKILSSQNRALGKEIIFDANRMAYASNKTKIAFVKEVGVLGAITLNEVREIFNMAPIEGGDKRVQTLNVINADNADNYQGGASNGEE